MTNDSKAPTGATWRDPLSMGFEAHRRLLLLRLRLVTSDSVTLARYFVPPDLGAGVTAMATACLYTAST